MKPDQVLQHRPVVLSEAERAQYFENGYLVLPDRVPAAWIERLRAAMAETIESSRSVTRSDSTFILEVVLVRSSVRTVIGTPAAGTTRAGCRP